MADLNYNIGLSLLYESSPKDNIVVDPSLLARSKNVFLESLTFRKRLIGLEPEIPEHSAGLASGLKLLGNIALEEGPKGYPEAIASYREARTVLEGLAATFPAVSTHRQELAQVYSNLNVLLSRQKHFEEALKVADAAVDLFHRVLKDHPDSPDTLSDLGLAQIQRADTIARLGDQPATRTALYEAAVSLARSATLTQEPNRREALAKHAVTVLASLRKQGYFDEPKRAAAFAVEPAFSEIRQRSDFPRP